MGQLLSVRPVTRETRTAQSSVGHISIEDLVVTFDGARTYGLQLIASASRPHRGNSYVSSDPPAAASRLYSTSRPASSHRTRDG